MTGALVTGASRGIGQAIAERLVKQGFYVIGTATTKGWRTGDLRPFRLQWGRTCTGCD